MTPGRPTLQALLDRITPLALFVAMSGLSLLLMTIGTCSMVDTDGPLPPPRPPPPPPDESVVYSYRYKLGYYRSLVEEDARKAKLPRAKKVLPTLQKPFPYFAEFNGSQRLRPGSSLETTHLRIQARAKKIWVGEAGRGYRAQHVVLSIKNRTSHHLAYRVQTRAYNCRGKGVLLHNAMAIAPGAAVERSECLLRPELQVVLRKVEVMEVPPLAYHYISRIDPLRVKYNRRTAEGHTSAGLPLCKILPWRVIQDALKQEQAMWVDVIDFYGRHNCDEYSFFVGYRWRHDGPAEVPAKPPGARARDRQQP